MADHILLVGFMGVGKSTTGKLLAGRLGARYLDSDERVKERTGLTVPEIFARRGEAAFRAEESEVLREACAATGPVVVGVAGGAVLDPANRALMRTSGTVVWLRARLETIVQRVGDGRGRPLLGDDPAAAVRRLYPQREQLYAELADVVVDVDDVAAVQVAGEIAAALGR